MQNYDVFSKLKTLECVLPDCDCEKCTQLRLEVNICEHQDIQSFERCLENISNEDEEQIVDNISVATCVHKNDSETAKTTLKDPNTSKSFAKYKGCTIPTFNMSAFNFMPHSVSSVLCDFVGIISFFIMISIMFWIAVSQFIWRLFKKLLRAKRSVQYITLALFLLLCASITYHAMKGRHHHNRNIRASVASQQMLALCKQANLATTAKQTPKHFHKNCRHKKFLHLNSKKCNNIDTKKCVNAKKCEMKPNDKLMEKKNPSLCDLCAKNFKAKNNMQSSLSDKEIREMYKRYKLYTVPSDMKFPPSYGHVFEVLAGLLESLADTVNRSFF